MKPDRAGADIKNGGKRSVQMKCSCYGFFSWAIKRLVSTFFDDCDETTITSTEIQSCKTIMKNFQELHNGKRLVSLHISTLL